MSHRVYFDHDSADSELLRDLRRRGHDCLTSAEASMGRASDIEQLDFADSERRILVTANQSDFARLHAERLGTGRTHSGIIIASQQLSLRSKLRRLVILLAAVQPEEFEGRLEYLGNWPEE
jgi:hypothetical protein